MASGKIVMEGGRAVLKPVVDAASDAFSRLARADASGFLTDVYHGTGRAHEIDMFQPGGFARSRGAGHPTGALGTWTSDSPEVAGEFANFAGIGDNAPSVMPLRARMQNPRVYDVDPEWLAVETRLREIDASLTDEVYDRINKASEEITAQYRNRTGRYKDMEWKEASDKYLADAEAIEDKVTGGLTAEKRDLINRQKSLKAEGRDRDPFHRFMDDIGYKPGYSFGDRTADEVADQLWDEGIDSVQIRNTTVDAPEGQRINQYLHLSPNDLRSRFAEFIDTQGGNILGSAMPVAAAVGLAAGSQDAEASFAGVAAKTADKFMLGTALAGAGGLYAQKRAQERGRLEQTRQKLAEMYSANLAPLSPEQRAGYHGTIQPPNHPNVEWIAQALDKFNRRLEGSPAQLLNFEATAPWLRKLSYGQDPSAMETLGASMEWMP